MNNQPFVYRSDSKRPARGRDHGRDADVRLLVLAEFLEVERRRSTTFAEREAVDELLCDLPGAMAQMERVVS